MLALTLAQLATTEQLFEYKSSGFDLEPFPGYSSDQWGIKAHNRPWIAAQGDFAPGQTIMEVGGAYSTLPHYLAAIHGLEAWVGDDFGMQSGDAMWSRWGDPHEVARRHPQITYVFEPMGSFSPQYPDHHFDRIFSVSTLEHIAVADRLPVLKDMNRCLKPGGKMLHTIDVSSNWKRLLAYAFTDSVPFSGLLRRTPLSRLVSQIRQWISLLRQSGVKIGCRIPHSGSIFNREIMVESPDVVYRYYPPNDAPKRYCPNASLLLIIEDR